MASLAVDYNKRLEAFKLIYPEVLKQSLAPDSPFGKLETMLKDFVKKGVIRNDDSYKTIAQSLLTLSQSITAQSQATTISLILQGDENEVNAAKSKLLEAQAATEAQKPNLIKRQIRQIDDTLAIEGAKVMQGYSFGLAAGGLNVPVDVEQRVKKLIDTMTNRIQQK